MTTAMGSGEKRGELPENLSGQNILTKVEYGPLARHALYESFPRVPERIEELGETIKTAFVDYRQKHGAQIGYSFEISAQGFFLDMGRDVGIGGGGFRIEPDASFVKVTCTEAQGILRVLGIEVSLERPTDLSQLGNT